MFLIDNDYWEVKKTPKKGMGVFCKKEIKANTIIGEYTGTKIKIAEYDLDKDKDGLYLMFLNDRYAIYPDLNRPDIHLMNHSCTPNCWIINKNGRVYFITLRNIKAGEELTISYLLAPKRNCSPCTHVCYCGSESCTGTMHQTQENYESWQKFQNVIK